jgi:molecular chaperone IbpA
MRTLDIPEFWRSTVGFDRVFDMLGEVPRFAEEGDYPPCDIVRKGSDAYRVSLAVAGFSADEIKVTVEQNVLKVTGEKAGAAEGDFLHHGIVVRSFERQFNLEDHVEVEGAWLEDGILQIDLVRHVPETMKPRRIPIGTSQSRSETPARGSARQPAQANA